MRLRLATLWSVLSTHPVIVRSWREAFVADSETQAEDLERAKVLGEHLKHWRRKRGLNRPEVITEMEKLGLQLSYSHLAKLESGARSLAAVAIEVREGLRYLYRVELEEWEAKTGLHVPIDDPDPPSPEKLEAIRAAGYLAVNDRYIRFPVFAGTSAGVSDPDPLEGEAAYISVDKLKAKGANPRDVVVYRVNGDCMVSTEARQIERNIAHGDYVAVDTRRRPQPGDTVVAWWAEDEKLVIKRFRVEREGIILYPMSPGHPTLVLPHEDEVNIIGVVVWREG